VDLSGSTPAKTPTQGKVAELQGCCHVMCIAVFADCDGSGCQPSLTRATASTATPTRRRKGFTPRNAMHAVWADGFDPEAASADDVLVPRLLNWGETIGTLTKNGLLDTDLVLDWLWVAGVWTRVGPAARKARDKHGVPELYENFEALAAKQGS